MTGVAGGPFGLKIESLILTRRGGFVANASESPRLLCCEIGILDVLGARFLDKSGRCVLEIIHENEHLFVWVLDSPKLATRAFF